MISKEQLLDIQANIFKGHRKDHCWCFFLQFRHNATTSDVRRWVSQFSGRVTSARQDYLNWVDEEAEVDKNVPSNQPTYSDKTVTCFFLSAKGYRRLGYQTYAMPADPSFRLGMKNGEVNGKLADPASIMWEPYYQQDIHALVLIADQDPAVLAKRHIELATELSRWNIGMVLMVEKGRMQRGTRSKKHYVEHFGFSDGHSNPFFEFNKEGNLISNNTGVALAQDQFGGLGSYLVFRKLEQNVKAFNEQVAELASELGLEKAYLEAQVVGRFKDGTPLEKAATDGHQGGFNNFTYKEDPTGGRCPFHSHIRKANPRFKECITGEEGKRNLVKEEEYYIVRRGLSYGLRAPDLSDEPESGVGMLFMCYQRSIQQQYEHIQQVWCNGKGPSDPDHDAEMVVGIDPIIGQRILGNQTQRWNTTWTDHSTKKSLIMDAPGTRSNGDNSSTVRRSFKDVVKLLGGEYFYAPALSFLRSLPELPPPPPPPLPPPPRPPYKDFFNKYRFGYGLTYKP